MKTAIKPNLSALLAAGAAAGLALAAMGFAGNAQARDNVQWSVGVATPGAVVNVGNVGSIYPQPVLVQAAPVYVQQRPVFVQPAPVFVQPRPVFVQPAPVYMQAQPVYYERERRHHGHKWQRGYEARQGYGPVYYQRDDRGGDHQRGDSDRHGHDGRR